jgi:hypothetical protein
MKTTTLYVSYGINIGKNFKIGTCEYHYFPIGISVDRILFNHIENATRANAGAFHQACEYDLTSFKILGITAIEEDSCISN